MRWTRGYRSDQVEDRRNQSFGGGGGGGPGIGVLFWLFSRFGLPGVLIGGALLYFAGGGLQNDSSSSDGAPAADSSSERAPAADDREAPLVQFVSFVFDDVQKTWATTFGQQRPAYQLAHLVLFRDRTRSGCGTGTSFMGPFYCPNDQRVYIDLSFYQQLRQRFGAPGDFAQAYVIGHEMGHHVQHLLGLDEHVRRAASSERTGESSASVRLELQADCLAGIWARSAERRQLLEPGDLDEALKAAAAIGDDRLQKQSAGEVAPESFTHGTSQQRQRWLRRGYQEGSLQSCDTFNAREL